MITKVKQNFTSLIFNVLSNKSFSKMSKPRKYFIAQTDGYLPASKVE